MQAVNGLILDRLKSDVALINQLGLYIISAGGKRLRPMLAILAARALGYTGTHHHLLAAIVEFIHTATLLHDDVVDESTLRRGRETANTLFGNQASVLVGDYLYTRAFQMMVELENPIIMKVFSDTTNIIAEGEVMQLMNVHDPDITEARYFEVIRSKTAVLFAAATGLAAELDPQERNLYPSLYDYGLHLGLAFQLVDDALDYAASAEEMGKNVGDDLAEGKPTLPLIRVLQTGSETERAMVRRAIESGGLDDLPAIKQAITSCGGIEYTLEKAREESRLAQEALASLPSGPYRDALAFLADFAVNRSY